MLLIAIVLLKLAERHSACSSILACFSALLSFESLIPSLDATRLATLAWLARLKYLKQGLAKWTRLWPRSAESTEVMPCA